MAADRSSAAEERPLPPEILQDPAVKERIDDSAATPGVGADELMGLIRERTGVEPLDRE